jgi:hypothetical protein
MSFNHRQAHSPRSFNEVRQRSSTVSRCTLPKRVTASTAVCTALGDLVVRDEPGRIHAQPMMAAAAWPCPVGRSAVSMVRVPQQVDDYEVASLQVVSGDWAAYQAMSLWLFHTPPGAVPGLGAGVPAIAATNSG